MPVKGRWEAPHTSPASPKFALLLRRVLDEAVRGIGDYSVN